MTDLARTPWVDRTLKDTWDRIAAQVPASWMPETIPGRALKIEELGCGVYGCVAPVHESNMVFKITSDVSEARFVAMAKELEYPEGIVKYYKIFALKGVQYRRRPLFVLWRQAAKDIGSLAQIYRQAAAAVTRRRGSDEYETRTLREGIQQLDGFLRSARYARHRMLQLLKRSPREKALADVWQAFETMSPEHDPRHYRGVPKIGILLRQCWGLAMMMQNTDFIFPIGTALGHYMDEGILLADVHMNNIGRDIESNHLLITDPGHAIEFHPRWTQLPKIPFI